MSVSIRVSRVCRFPPPYPSFPSNVVGRVLTLNFLKCVVFLFFFFLLVYVFNFLFLHVLGGVSEKEVDPRPIWGGAFESSKDEGDKSTSKMSRTHKSSCPRGHWRPTGNLCSPNRGNSCLSESLYENSAPFSSFSMSSDGSGGGY